MALLGTAPTTVVMSWSLLSLAILGWNSMLVTLRVWDAPPAPPTEHCLSGDSLRWPTSWWPGLGIQYSEWLFLSKSRWKQPWPMPHAPCVLVEMVPYWGCRGFLSALSEGTATTAYATLGPTGATPGAVKECCVVCREQSLEIVLKPRHLCSGPVMRGAAPIISKILFGSFIHCRHE